MESISGANDRQAHVRTEEPDQVDTPIRGHDYARSGLRGSQHREDGQGKGLQAGIGPYVFIGHHRRGGALLVRGRVYDFQQPALECSHKLRAQAQLGTGEMSRRENDFNIDRRGELETRDKGSYNRAGIRAV